MLSAAKHLAMRNEMLRCAQHDKLLPILIVKVHHRVLVERGHQDAVNRVPTTKADLRVFHTTWLHCIT